MAQNLRTVLNIAVIYGWTEYAPMFGWFCGLWSWQDYGLVQHPQLGHSSVRDSLLNEIRRKFDGFGGVVQRR